MAANRYESYERLLAVSRDGDWTGWCRFFLTGVKAQAERNHDKAAAILALYERMKRQVAGLTRSQFAIHALDWIFAKPIFKSSDFVASAGIPAPTAKCILRCAAGGRVVAHPRAWWRAPGGGAGVPCAAGHHRRPGGVLSLPSLERPKAGRSRPPPVGIKQSGKATFA